MANLPRSAIRPLILFVVTCAVAYGVERLSEHLVSDGSEGPLSQSIFGLRGGYQYLVSSWPRDLVPRYTVVIKIDPKIDGLAVSHHNVCDQRAFLARFITVLANSEPSVIVLDKFITKDVCPSSNPGTLALQKAITEVSSRIPVVLGLRIDERETPEASPDGPAYHIREPVRFTNAVRMREGIINIDRDSRRVPLGWFIVRDAGSPAEWRNTLSLEAAEAHELKLFEKYPALKTMRDDRITPYVSLIHEEGFTSYLVGNILCGGPVIPVEYSEGCKGRRNADSMLQYLRGRIALIGEIDPDSDEHTTVIGRIPGLVLQANYVEALLDGRYFKPVPGWLDYAVGLIYFVIIEFALRHRRLFVGMLWVSIATIATFVLVAMAVRYLGYYVTVTVSTLVLLLKLIERIFGKGETNHAP